MIKSKKAINSLGIAFSGNLLVFILRIISPCLLKRN